MSINNCHQKLYAFVLDVVVILITWQELKTHPHNFIHEQWIMPLYTLYFKKRKLSSPIAILLSLDRQRVSLLHMNRNKSNIVNEINSYSSKKKKKENN